MPQLGREWLAALDALAAEIAAHRGRLRSWCASGVTEPLPRLSIQLPEALGPIPAELATYARAVMMDGWALEQELGAVQERVSHELTTLATAARLSGRRPAPARRARLVDRAL